MRLTQNASFIAIVFYSILFLFAFQLFADFVRMITGFIVPNSELPLQLIALFLLLSPLLLYFIPEAHASTLIFILDNTHMDLSFSRSLNPKPSWLEC